MRTQSHTEEHGKNACKQIQCDWRPAQPAACGSKEAPITKRL